MAANEDSQLIETLTEAGLDGEYWAGILQHQLDVCQVEQFQDLNISHYNLLRRHILNDQEAAILRKLLHIDPKPGTGECEATTSVKQSDKLSLSIDITSKDPVNVQDEAIGPQESKYSARHHGQEVGSNDAPLKSFTHSELPKLKAENTLESDVADKFTLVLSQLGLTKYHPGKLTLQDAVSVRMFNRTEGTMSLTDLPWYIIHKLFLTDFSARDDIMEKIEMEEKTYDDNSDIDFDDLISNLELDQEKHTLSTLDVLAAIFSCCDNFLKQTLAEKLFLCKLAVPFLYPTGTENEPMLSLWALRTIDLDGKSATDDPVPVVSSFLKLGEPSQSKSKLLNDILNDNNHHTFVNYHSKNGPVKRQCSDGLVECGWFVHSKQSDTDSKSKALDCTTMFLNLRGDASRLARQRQLLCKLSSVVVVVVTASDLPAYKSTFQELRNSAHKVLLVLLTQPGDTVRYKEDLKRCFSDVGKETLQGQNCKLVLNRSKTGRVLNDNEMRSTLCHSVSEMLKDCRTKSLQDCIQEQQDVVTDENVPECLQGKTLALDLFNDVISVEVEKRKDTLLPLQQKVWQSYCGLEKKLHRSSTVPDGCTLQEHKEEMRKAMKIQREEQMKLLSQSIGMKFIQVLQMTGDVILRFCLSWLKLMLDKESRATLSKLHRKYGEKWDLLRATKEGRNDPSEEKRLKEKVANMEHILANASVGVEHLFREIAQIYETVHGSYGSNTELKIATKLIPKIAARLLMDGYPLELLDGDASGIPLTWLQAVLDQLSELIGSKKLFVVSVMGVQSSGKSTLLNTMFGLKFAVSAGRCTRGAFLQLVPVHKTCDLPFSYVLVIDTEGLRAPELAAAKHIYDNELATLAVGLADVTLINVKGENTSEIKDILQIVVHAFLRMSAVNKTQKYRHTCVFIHQNVADTNASEMMMHGHHKLLDTLDTMAKEAAASEGIHDVRTFSDIIRFDCKKHNWYFPDLWNGNPPMAPVNPKYSHDVQTVRCCLLDIANSQHMFSFVADLFSRVNDIWHGILCDDFVFSFRNTLEVNAYIQVNSMYNELICELQAMTIGFIRETATKQLSSCERSDAIDSVTQGLIATLSNRIQEKADDLRNKLEMYFKTHDYNDIIIQWKQAKLLGLSNEAEKLTQENIQTLWKKADERKVVIITEKESSPHIKAISKWATDLADCMKGQNITDSEMKLKFQQFINENNPIHVKENTKSFAVDLELEKALRNAFHNKLNLLQEERDRLKTYETTDDYLTDRKERQRWPHFVQRLVDKVQLNRSRDKNLILLAIFDSVKHCIEQKFTPQHPPQREYVSQVFHLLEQKIRGLSPKMSSSDKIKLYVAVAQYSSGHFTQIQNEYITNYSVSAYVKSYYNSIWDIFRNTVQQTTAEVIAADLFCDQVEKHILDTAHSRIADTLIGSVLRDFSHSKGHLIVNMLKDLAEREDFDEYVKYIYSPKDFATSWLENYFNKTLQHSAMGETTYFEIIKPELGNLFSNISQCIDEVTQVMKTGGQKRTKAWIQYVCTHVDLPLTENALQLMSERHIEDFDHLQKCIRERLRKMLDELLGKCKDATPEKIQWPDGHPHKQILERLWGCDETCPFCGEPCSNTTADHYNTENTCHSCIKHKPTGIIGLHSLRSKKLAVKTCEYYIHKNAQFACKPWICSPYGSCSTREQVRADDEPVWHEYRDYKTYIPDWDIQPDPADSMSKYWQWFMATFMDQLKEIYGKQMRYIPKSWKSITKRAAINDLTTVYNTAAK